MRHSLCWVTLLVMTTGSVAAADTIPKRVISLDYCADQFVLRMLPRDRILAVSPDAEKHFSYMRESAAGIKQVRPLAEDVLIMKPDLVIRSYGGGPHVTGFFQRAGVEVLQVPYANDIAGIRDSTLFIANGLGAPEQGEEIVADMDSRLNALRSSGTKRTALYMTPTGVTSGPDTLIHEMLLTAGLQNFETKSGWRNLPLEQLAYQQPDMVAGAFFNAGSEPPSTWSAMRHPVAKRQVSERPTVMLQGAWTACGAWFLVDAIEALAKQ